MIGWICNSCTFKTKTFRAFSRHVNNYRIKQKNNDHANDQASTFFSTFNFTISLIKKALHVIFMKNQNASMQNENINQFNELKDDLLKKKDQNTQTIKDRQKSPLKFQTNIEKLLTCAVTKNQLFVDVKHKCVDESLKLHFRLKRERDTNENKRRYVSFQNDLDYRFAYYFVKMNFIKNNVDEFFNDVNLKTL